MTKEAGSHQPQINDSMGEIRNSSQNEATEKIIYRFPADTEDGETGIQVSGITQSDMQNKSIDQVELNRKATKDQASSEKLVQQHDNFNQSFQIADNIDEGLDQGKDVIVQEAVDVQNPYQAHSSPER